MTIRYFKKIKNRIGKLEWLTERVSIDTEYDEDADVGRNMMKTLMSVLSVEA
ncbi:MAG: hypothetical protein JRD93_18355 [Deltaproteobacteria bacterium]|nr:hypothetical protein [Deltaproteobacteria bacterium]